MDRIDKIAVQYMWTENGAMWYSICGPNRKQCGTVYVDRTGNSAVKYIWTKQRTVRYTIFGPNWEQCGTVYVDRTGKSVVQYMWAKQGTVWYSICGPNREHIISELRKLRIKVLHSLYSSHYDTRILKSRFISWAGIVARIKEIKNALKIFV